MIFFCGSSKDLLPADNCLYRPCVRSLEKLIKFKKDVYHQK